MSCELRDVSRKWPCTLGSTSAVYILRRRAMLPKDLPAFLKLIKSFDAIAKEGASA